MQPGIAAPGSSDLHPAGIPQDITGIPGMLGGPEPLSGAPSGMHMGPHDPLFEMRSRARPGMGLPEGPFPGVRYDPVNPQGLEVSYCARTIHSSSLGIWQLLCMRLMRQQFQ